MELNKIYHGDILEVISEFPDDFVDLIITSPPYNLGIEYNEWNDNLPYDEYLAWSEGWLKELYRVLKDDGRLCLNHYLSCGDKNFRFAPLMDLNWIAVNKIGFKHHGLAIWEDATVSRLTAWGSWLSASSPYINSPFEGILILYKNFWKKQKEGISTIQRDDFIMACSGAWKIVPEKNRMHPAPFPEKLAQLCIDMFSYVGDLVFDPFMGSGTVAVVAERLGRKWIGVEIDEEYIEMANDRLRKVQTDLLSSIDLGGK